LAQACKEIAEANAALAANLASGGADPPPVRITVTTGLPGDYTMDPSSTVWRAQIANTGDTIRIRIPAFTITVINPVNSIQLTGSNNRSTAFTTMPIPLVSSNTSGTTATLQLAFSMTGSTTAINLLYPGFSPTFQAGDVLTVPAQRVTGLAV
jgi:hypothetical protein